MFKQGLYQFIPSLKVFLVSVLWVLGLILVLIGVLCTTPGA